LPRASIQRKQLTPIAKTPELIMNEYQARTISTAAIWISVAFLFIFGVFRFNWNGLLAGVLWTAVAIALAAAPAVATQAIWNRPPSKEARPDAPSEQPKV
jgi:hypothetical protein